MKYIPGFICDLTLGHQSHSPTADDVRWFTKALQYRILLNNSRFHILSRFAHGLSGYQRMQKYTCDRCTGCTRLACSSAEPCGSFELFKDARIEPKCKSRHRIVGGEIRLDLRSDTIRISV
jgi:hypothetical protein